MKLFEYFENFENEINIFANSLSQNDGDDLIQHAWVKAINNQFIFEDMNYYQTRSWFYTVIRNRFYDNLKKSKNISYFIDTEYSFGSSDNIDQYLTKNILIQLLDILDETDKEIVFMRYFGGKNSKEIGSQLGINASTVRYRIQKSLSQIRSKIDRSDYYD